MTPGPFYPPPPQSRLYAHPNAGQRQPAAERYGGERATEKGAKWGKRGQNKASAPLPSRPPSRPLRTRRAQEGSGKRHLGRPHSQRAGRDVTRRDVPLPPRAERLPVCLSLGVLSALEDRLCGASED